MSTPEEKIQAINAAMQSLRDRRVRELEKLSGSEDAEEQNFIIKKIDEALEKGASVREELKKDVVV